MKLDHVLTVQRSSLSIWHRENWLKRKILLCAQQKTLKSKISKFLILGLTRKRRRSWNLRKSLRIYLILNGIAAMIHQLNPIPYTKIRYSLTCSSVEEFKPALMSMNNSPRALIMKTWYISLTRSIRKERQNYNNSLEPSKEMISRKEASTMYRLKITGLWRKHQIWLIETGGSSERTTTSLSKVGEFLTQWENGMKAIFLHILSIQWED